MRFAVRRAREHVGRLSLLAFVVALVVVGIGGLDAVSARMLGAGVSQMFTDAEPDARTVRVEAKESDEAEAQDTAVRSAISRAFDGTDITVTQQAAIVAEAQVAGGEPVKLRLLDDPRLPDHAELTDGAWPLAAGEIALPDAAANRLRLGVGDSLTLEADSTRLTLVGTWAADSPVDSAWHGDPAVASGMSDGAIGPAMVSAGALEELPATSKLTWEIDPPAADLVDLPTLQQAIAALSGVPKIVDPERQHGTRVVGRLGETLQRQSAAVGATRGLLIAPQLIVALLGALVLGIVLTSLSTARGAELALLRARGASVRTLAVDAVAEAACFTAGGAALALGVLASTVGATTIAAFTAVGALVFVCLASAIVAVRRTGRADGALPEDLRSDAGARPLPALLLFACIAGGLATLSTWQLFATGSIVRSDGTVDPLAVVAPALLLVAACTLAPLAAGPIAVLAERLLARTRGIAPILPLRQIARRAGDASLAILCLALAAAAVAVAVAAPEVGETAEQRTRLALVAGDVRMITEDGLDFTADDLTANEVASWSGVTGATEVLRAPITVGADEALIVIGEPDALQLPTSGTAPPRAGEGIPGSITRSLAERIGAEVGTTFSIRIRTVATPVPVTVASVVDAIRGVGGGWGVAISADALLELGVDRPANELWVDSKTPQETATQLREHATHASRILTMPQVSSAPVTSVAPIMLTAGALLACALGLLGFFAASSASAGGRRRESFVLRALGMRHAQLRTLRGSETGIIAVYALLTGAALGAVVAVAVLPLVLGATS